MKILAQQHTLALVYCKGQEWPVWNKRRILAAVPGTLERCLRIVRSQQEWETKTCANELYCSLKLFFQTLLSLFFRLWYRKHFFSPLIHSGNTRSKKMTRLDVSLVLNNLRENASRTTMKHAARRTEDKTLSLHGSCDSMNWIEFTRIRWCWSDLLSQHPQHNLMCHTSALQIAFNVEGPSFTYIGETSGLASLLHCSPSRVNCRNLAAQQVGKIPKVNW